MNILINWLIAALVILVAAYILPGVSVNSFLAALVLAVVLGLINALIRPFILLITLPINLLTLGLFTFVINALMILLAAQIVPGFSVAGFWWALLFSLLLSIIGGLIKNIDTRTPAR